MVQASTPALRTKMVTEVCFMNWMRVNKVNKHGNGKEKDGREERGRNPRGRSYEARASRCPEVAWEIKDRHFISKIIKRCLNPEDASPLEVVL